MTTDPATDTLPPAHGADPRGIAGWLLLPVAGLVLTAAVGLSTIVDIARSPDMLSLAFTYRTSITIGVIGTAILWTMLPAVALVLLVLGFNFLGDGLRDLTDPKQRRTAASAGAQG